MCMEMWPKQGETECHPEWTKCHPELPLQAQSETFASGPIKYGRCSAFHQGEWCNQQLDVQIEIRGVWALVAAARARCLMSSGESLFGEWQNMPLPPSKPQFSPPHYSSQFTGHPCSECSDGPSPIRSGQGGELFWFSGGEQILMDKCSTEDTSFYR